MFQININSPPPSRDISLEETPEAEEVDQTLPVVEMVESKDPHDESTISLHALSSISSPQTLKILGYNKHHKVVVLIDSGITHNFIHMRITHEVNYFIQLVSNFQIIIANGGMMKCGGHYENFKLQMGDYHLETHMFPIDIGGCDIVLGKNGYRHWDQLPWILRTYI